MFMYLILILSLLSCQGKRFESEEDLVDYLKTHKSYYMVKTIKGVEFKLNYRPTDLMVLQELGTKTNKKTIDSLRENYSKYVYFLLTMSVEEEDLLQRLPANRNQYGALINELAFGMREKVNLISKNDTLDLLDYIYPRMYGLTKNTSLLFVFRRENIYEKNDYFQFVIKDFGLQTGSVKFKLKTNDIIDEPGLNFEKINYYLN